MSFRLITYWLNVYILFLLLGGCSQKEHLQGKREGVLSSEEVGERNGNKDAAPVKVDKEVANREFSQPYMNAAHCYAPLKFSFPTTKAWSKKLDFEATKSAKITAGPVVANGRAFCADAGGIVYAFDAKSGRELWRRSVTIAGKDGQTGMAIACDDSDHLIVASCFSECFSLDCKNGKINWRIKLPAPAKGDAITIRDGQIFLMCSNSSLQVVNIESGKLLWSHSGITANSIFLGGAGAAVVDGVVYLAYPSGEIYALLMETGAVVWESVFPKFSIGDAIQAFTHPKASPVIKDGIAYFVAANEQTAAFDARTGQRLWIKDYGSIQTPIVSGNSIFVLNPRSELVCLNRLTGCLRWKTVLDNRNKHDWYGMVLLKDQILCISPEGVFTLISVKDGTVKQINASVNNVSVNPVIADSMLYILSDNGELSAYRTDK